MKNFWPPKIKFDLYGNSFKKTINPFLFWQIIVATFFVGLGLVFLIHLCVFYSLGSLALDQTNEMETNLIFDQKKLEIVVSDLEQKQENFNKYFNEKPNLTDPSRGI